MGRQSIKYQTTTVSATKSAGEIQTLVVRYGASRCELRWDEAAQLQGIRFAIRDERLGEVPVRLTAKTDRIFEILQKRRTVHGHKTKYAKADREQAYRIAWRQLKDLTEQLLLAVETGLFTLTDAFMSGLETEDPNTGEPITFGELLTKYGSTDSGGLKLLGAGVPEADYTIQ